MDHHQILNHEPHIPKTAFVTPLGRFEHGVVPFGFANAPLSLQRLMNTLFDHMPFVSVYLEDSLILSHTPEEHADHVRQFLFILQDNNLHSKLRRNNFFPSSVQLLGRIIFAHRIRVSPKQVEIESNWSVPVDLRSLHSFLGLMKYYRRFIRALAKTAAPWIILPTKSVHSN